MIKKLKSMWNSYEKLSSELLSIKRELQWVANFSFSQSTSANLTALIKLAFSLQKHIALSEGLQEAIKIGVVVGATFHYQNMMHKNTCVSKSLWNVYNVVLCIQENKKLNLFLKKIYFLVSLLYEAISNFEQKYILLFK